MRPLLFSILLLAATSCTSAQADCFDVQFSDSTVRVDVKIIAHGPDKGLYADTAMQWSGWHGRRVNLDKLFYQNLISYAVIDKTTGDTIYVDSKYMQPAVHSMDATSDYAVLLFPKPKNPAILSVSSWLLGEGVYLPWMSMQTDLSELPVKEAKPSTVPYKYLRRSSGQEYDYPTPLTLTIVSEGYTTDEMDKFLADASRLDSTLFAQEDFNSLQNHFDVLAVMLPSEESGITYPSKDINVNSALGAHFDSFGLERLVTIKDSRMLWDALVGIPAQHILILANTEYYGGSGGYNDYAIACAHHYWSMPMIVHEFGHSFANLGDEYEDGYDITYTADHEPDEPNITTLCDFSKKWADLVESGEAGLIEGAGYQSKGVYRGCEKCLMRALPDIDLCVVCNRAMTNTIKFYSEERNSEK